MRIHKRAFEPLVSNNLVIQIGKEGVGKSGREGAANEYSELRVSKKADQ